MRDNASNSLRGPEAVNSVFHALHGLLSFENPAHADLGKMSSLCDEEEGGGKKSRQRWRSETPEGRSLFGRRGRPERVVDDMGGPLVLEE